MGGVYMIDKETAEFLKAHKDWLTSDNYGMDKLYDTYTSEVGLGYNLTQAFHSMKIDPTQYLHFVPTEFMSGNVSLKRYTIPTNLIEIHSRAFEDCTELYSVKLHDKISYIGMEAFIRCEALKEIELPPMIDHIANDVFCECRSLEKVVIPKNVGLIEGGAFSECVSLTTIHYLGTTEEFKRDVTLSGTWKIGSDIKTITCVDGEIKAPNRQN